MSDDFVKRLRAVVDHVEALVAENQKLHGWVQSAEQSAGVLQRKVNAYESRIEADRAAMQQAVRALEDPCYDAMAIRLRKQALTALRGRLK